MDKITNTFAFNAVMTLLMMVGLINSFIATEASIAVGIIGIVGSLFAMLYFANQSHKVWIEKRK